MKIEFYNKETGEKKPYQDEYMVDSDGIVWEEDYFSELPRAVFKINNNLGWRIVNEQF